MATQPDIAQRAVSVKAASASLGVSQTAFHSWVRAGKIRVVKLGKRTLVPCAELDRLVADPIPPCVSGRERRERNA